MDFNKQRSKKGTGASETEGETQGTYFVHDDIMISQTPDVDIRTSPTSTDKFVENSSADGSHSAVHSDAINQLNQDQEKYILEEMFQKGAVEPVDEDKDQQGSARDTVQQQYDAGGNLVPQVTENCGEMLKSGEHDTNEDELGGEVEEPSLKLLALPVDSLHCIASFLPAVDWANFGLTTTSASPICRDVFTKVRVHGFRCATEIVTAWVSQSQESRRENVWLLFPVSQTHLCHFVKKLGEHTDARELAALYIQAGVPVYPLSLGHSYHTLVWRMNAEARELQKQNFNRRRSSEGNTGNGDGTIAENDDRDGQSRPIDPFFVERYENRSHRMDSSPSISYLEEKCLYCFNKAAETDVRLGSRISLASRTNFAPTAPVLGPGMHHAHGQWDGRTRLPNFRPGNQTQAGHRAAAVASPTLSISEQLRPAQKIAAKVHRHLFDQHLLNRASVDDENGAMIASRISLAADFFHQNFGESPRTCEGAVPDHVSSLGEIAEGREIPQMAANDVRVPISYEGSPSSSFNIERRLGGSEFLDVAAETSFSRSGDFVNDVLARHDSFATDEFEGESRSSSNFGTPLQALAPSLLLPPPPPAPVPTPDELSSNENLSNSEPSILSSMDLEIYSFSSANSASLISHRDGAVELKSHLKTRFGVYQRRLETLLSQNDSPGFEECLLDFWDEFLPVTANVHFHDRHTAVPRVSCLHRFLTRPCPKAIGIIQCEIERIKISSKRKGVNMKGRLFPTYEYRLFIRDRRNDASVAPESSVDDESRPLRRDTVLMTAKNRGRKHLESTGVVPSPGASKKGVNNYFLYMPQQVDVDTHFRSVNRSDDAELIPNGASADLPTRAGDNNAPVLLGRLQSNFIGTEFQIFIPAIQKNAPKKPVARSSNHGVSSDSESDFDYDSGVSSDNGQTIARRRNRFHRRRSNPATARRNARETSGDHCQPHPIDEEEVSVDSESLRRPKRSYSLPSFRRSSRNSRRAVANSVDSPDSQNYQPVLCEEEDGVITYTANLLGNRPRIMDVCVPRVSSGGIPGAEWKRYISSLDDVGEATNRMLTHFKQLQQRLDSLDHNEAEDDEEHGEGGLPDDFGLLALQNRPPWWNVELGAFVLNFGGRVSVASVKNFQLCDRNDQDHIMLQFGRIQGRHAFTMDFQHPLTAVQAFAIAISSLQSRISFG
jgi:hypothetical protein